MCSASLSLLLVLSVPVLAQTLPMAAPQVVKRTFNDVKVLPHTPVRAQAKSGTCWCFATVSLLEAEVMRKGRGEVDLAEMHLVRATYPERAKMFVRLHGGMTWGEGSQNDHALQAMARVGLVPEAAYPGLKPGEKTHDHRELAQVLEGFLGGVRKAGQPSVVWQRAFEGLLDAYLGAPVASFTFENRTWTPQGFMRERLALDPADYVHIGSFGCYPPNQRFRLETADNWSADDCYWNVSLEDFETVLDSAIEQGYSFAIASDISEKGFAMKTGHALLIDPDAKPEEERELVVTPDLRTAMYNDWRTTDDHCMHCVGTAADDKGGKFYRIKNSWGTENSPHKGYLYMSRSYMLGKTFYITLHKEAVPKAIRQKLGL